MQEVVSTGGKSVRVDGSGVTALGGSGADASSRKGRFTVRTEGRSIEMRVLGTTVYAQLPPGAARQKLAGGKPWIKVDSSEAASALTGPGQAPDVQAQLAYLRGAQHATKVGTQTVDGVATTHYRTTVPVSALKVPGLKAGRPMTIDVWVDGQQRVRLEKGTLAFTAGSGTGADSGSARGGSIDMTMHLTDFGTPVDVSAPPSGQTTDITRKLSPGQDTDTTASG
jgi:hypothetical protein